MTKIKRYLITLILITFIVIIPVSATSIVAFPNMHYTHIDIDEGWKYINYNNDENINVRDSFLHWHHKNWVQTNQNITICRYNENVVLGNNNSIIPYRNAIGV